MQVVITVDDLGLHPAVRRATEHLLSRGRITSASLLANAPDAENCLAIKGLGLGVQLNVLQGKPFSHQELVNSILRHDGCFLGDHDVLLGRFLDGKVQLGQIETEWAAQIEFVLDHGVHPTHLTAHRSMLAWPGLMNVAGRLAEKYKVRWIRKAQHCDALLRNAPGNRSDFLNVCTMLQKRPQPIRTPDLVWGRGQEQGDGLPRGFLDQLRDAEHAVVEIVGTPGLVESGDEGLDKRFLPGPSKAQWGVALTAMESAQWPMVLETLGAKLAHYDELDETTKPKTSEQI